MKTRILCVCICLVFADINNSYAQNVARYGEIDTAYLRAGVSTVLMKGWWKFRIHHSARTAELHYDTAGRHIFSEIDYGRNSVTYHYYFYRENDLVMDVRKSSLKGVLFADSTTHIIDSVFYFAERNDSSLTITTFGRSYSDDNPGYNGLIDTTIHVIRYDKQGAIKILNEYFNSGRTRNYVENLDSLGRIIFLSDVSYWDGNITGSDTLRWEYHSENKYQYSRSSRHESFTVAITYECKREGNIEKCKDVNTGKKLRKRVFNEEGLIKKITYYQKGKLPFSDRYKYEYY